MNNNNENTSFSAAGHRERVKEHFLQTGMLGMSEHRALELLLFFSIPRGDVANVARELIYTFGNFTNVLQASYDDLKKIKGIGNNSAVFLKVVLGAFVYYSAIEAESITVVSNIDYAYALFKPFFLDATSERVCIICLDANDRHLGVRLVGEGNLISTSFNFRHLTSIALSLNAVKIFVAHNHVTDTLEPSAADWRITDFLIELLHPLNIYVMDHLIIGRHDKASMRQISRAKHLPIAWPQ